MSLGVSPDPSLTPRQLEDIAVVAGRERERVSKQQQRARTAQERAQAATAPNQSGYVVPPMPAGLRRQRKWLRDGHDAYSRREIGLLELTEMRRSVSAQSETYKAGAVVRQSLAAMRAAQAQERMAEVLAAVEHGGAVVGFLARLQESVGNGQRRPLPGVRAVLPSQSGSAS